ncbi:PREDICTED: solute carrier family 2, facilitated glucose transporter member 3-like [Priapulus caudatus]|uniref:Solute carrier family 2, facilitated glucose transporter member 3-like n=1 Tax=Priapulus caudatus TaxID=37621 RepID=A0ABM1DRH1_PRICU|nr:PREDICTED: solute carrier family 2, facilitated glucose transporter member 3-like [Priapulus caudatus]
MGCRDFMREKTRGLTPALLFTAISVTVGTTFPFGYNMVVMNAPQELLEQFFNESYNHTRGEYMDEPQLRLYWSVNSALYSVGAIFGCLSLSYLTDLLGRKGMMICINFVIFAVSAIMGLSKFAMSFEMIIVARFLYGVVAGLCSVATIHFMEIAPRHLRGALGGLYELGFASSMLISTALGLPHVLGNSDYWPILLSFTAFTSVLQLWTLPFTKESPRYLLVRKGKEDEARKSLIFFRGTTDVDKEMEELKIAANAQKNVALLSWLDILRDPGLRAALFVSCSIQLSLQLGGVIAVLYYSTKLFTSINITYPEAAYASMGIGAMKLLTNMFSMYVLERWGRRIPQLVGTGGQAVMTAILAIVLSFPQYAWARVASVAVTILFISFNTFGPATICFMITPELFRENARPSAVSMSFIVMYVTNTLVGVSFPTLKKVMGPYVFLIFSGCSVVLWVYIYRNMPETKGRSIEDIVKGFGVKSDAGKPEAVEDESLVMQNLCEKTPDEKATLRNGVGPSDDADKEMAAICEKDPNV